MSEPTDRTTWFSARQECSSRSGDLARIYNEEIRVILKERYLTDTKYWIGLVGLVWYWGNGMILLQCWSVIRTRRTITCHITYLVLHSRLLELILFYTVLHFSKLISN